jgi:hypothetical protein
MSSTTDAAPTATPQLSPAEGFILATVLLNQTSTPEIDWEAVCRTCGFKNRNVARTRVGQIKRKFAGVGMLVQGGVGRAAAGPKTGGGRKGGKSGEDGGDGEKDGGQDDEEDLGGGGAKQEDGTGKQNLLSQPIPPIPRASHYPIPNQHPFSLPSNSTNNLDSSPTKKRKLASTAAHPTTPRKALPTTTGPPNPKTPKSTAKKCSACGGVGHMKSNKKLCPLLNVSAANGLGKTEEKAEEEDEGVAFQNGGHGQEGMKQEGGRADSGRGRESEGGEFIAKEEDDVFA